MIACGTLVDSIACVDRTCPTLNCISENQKLIPGFLPSVQILPLRCQACQSSLLTLFLALAAFMCLSVWRKMVNGLKTFFSCHHSFLLWYRWTTGPPQGRPDNANWLVLCEHVCNWYNEHTRLAFNTKIFWARCFWTTKPAQNGIWRNRSDEW